MQRKVIPDILKGVAVILMIQVHVMELFMLPEIYESIFGKISLFLGGIPAAPVFMSIMGYFAASSSKGMPGQVLRGVKLIILGLLLNIGLNLHLLISIWAGDLQVDPFAYIFGADILFLAGLSLIFISIVQYFLGSNLWLFIFLTFLIPLSSDLFTPWTDLNGLSEYLMAFLFSQASWSYFPFFPWAAWVLAGYSFAIYEKKYGLSARIEKYTAWFVFMLMIPLALTLPWAANIITDLSLYYHHGLLFFLWGLGFLIFWMGLFRLIHIMIRTNYLMKYFGWLGRNVTLAYVIQWLIIGNIATAVYKTQPAWVFWVSLVLVLLATTILITLLALPVRSLKNKLR
jgi:hypothetical protein